MKHRIFLRLFLLLFAPFVSTHIASAEVVRSFDVVVRVQRDGALDISENILMDFEKTPRHGIYRTIASTRKNHPETKLKFTLLSVTDGKKKLPYQQETDNSFWEIKIGDANKLITGVHRYVIHYRVRNGLLKKGNKPLIYWNAIGNEWPFAIQKASARLDLPSGITDKNMAAAAFRGAVGSTEQVSTQRWRNSLLWRTNSLAAGEGLTFSVTLPENSIPVQN